MSDDIKFSTEIENSTEKVQLNDGTLISFKELAYRALGTLAQPELQQNNIDFLKNIQQKDMNRIIDGCKNHISAINVTKQYAEITKSIEIYKKLINLFIQYEKEYDNHCKNNCLLNHSTERYMKELSNSKNTPEEIKTLVFEEFGFGEAAENKNTTNNAEALKNLTTANNNTSANFTEQENQPQTPLLFK